ncbi:MAG: GNAT family N-acetyltransferase [Tetrasphaera sp.]|nr:GNAT family N-acetyltransferase [Tetrasphaera sp.]
MWAWRRSHTRCSSGRWPRRCCRHSSSSSRRPSRTDPRGPAGRTSDFSRRLVALAGDTPVGWCGVEPRTRLHHILSTRLVVQNTRFPLDDSDVWVIYCIFVPPAHRRHGVAQRVLTAAVAHAERSGAHAIEGLPMDLSLRGGKYPPGFSTGTLAMFEKEGFEAIASLPSGRTLVCRSAAAET